MTSIELLPLTPDAADRLSKAARHYEAGAVTLQALRQVAEETYGPDQALTALTIELASVTEWQPVDDDIQAMRDGYSGRLVPGYDRALECALEIKLRFPT